MSALRNAAAVLRCFTPATPELSVTDIVERLGLAKSTASWLLKLMAEEGFLEMAAASRRYRPGPLLIASGQLFRTTSSLVGAVDELIAAVAAEIGHTGYISILDGTDVFAIRMHPGSHHLRVVTPIGLRLPAFATAVGRSLLARHSDEDARELFQGSLPTISDQAPRTLDELLPRLATVREAGFAEADDEGNRGVGSVAVSIADPAAREAVSACISFPLSNVSADERQAIRERLVSGASELGRRFDDSFWTSRPMPSARVRHTAA
jgi:DNA-binding IclR family transcriptional regulator